MKYANQINMFLAITGCIAVLWVFSQTYLQPSPFSNLEIADISGNTTPAPTTQLPAVYQGEGTSAAKSAIYGNTPSRPAGSTPPLENVSAGKAAPRPGSSAGTPVARSSRGISAARPLQSGYRSQAVSVNSSNPSDETPGTAGTAENGAGTDRPANVGGFPPPPPPAGQSLGMEQSKRTPADSSSSRKYVPYRSSMANRPN